MNQQDQHWEGPETAAVSIIVPARNEEAHIAECLQSLISQRYGGNEMIVEIIVVDDGSLDGTRAVAEFFSKKDERVSVIHNDGRAGVSGALNLGIRRSRNPIVALIGGDCIASQNWLRHLVGTMKSRNADVVTGPISAVSGESRWARAEHARYEGWLRSKLQGASPRLLAGSNMAISRKLILDLGGFDENLPSKVDRDLAKRLLGHGHAIAYSEDAIVVHEYPTSLREYYHRAIWYSRGLCAFNRKHYGSWLSGPDTGRLLETVWLISSLILLCLLPFCYFLLRPFSTLAFVVVGGFMCLMFGMAFRRDAWALARVVTRRSTVDDFMLALVTHLGEKVGCIQALAVDRSPRRA